MRGVGVLFRAVLLAGLLAALPAHGLTVVPRTFDELVQLADVVLLGTVQQIHSESVDTGPGQSIFTFVDFTGLHVIKGRVDSQQYTLRVPGGVVGRYAEEYPGIPIFHTGQRYLVFIRGNKRDFFPVVGISQGLYRILTDGRGRQVVIRDDIATQAHLQHSLDSALVNAPGLDDFLDRIKKRLPSTGENTP